MSAVAEVPITPMRTAGTPRSTSKQVVFRFFQPAALLAILLFWGLAPQRLIDNPWTMIVAAAAVTAIVQALEWVNERHAGWRMNRQEFLTDAFYVVFGATVIAKAQIWFAETPLKAAKHAIGFTTPALLHAPFLLQVAMIVFLIEFGQYWMHRLMHNSPLWWTHAPHHHITQLNAAKGAVGNPLELFLVSLSVIAFFDFSTAAVFCAATILTAVPCFAHANIRFNPPRWYAFFFTTIEHHSLHHSLAYDDTRCNYANSLILCDRLCGTFRAGEAAIVGQDERIRLSIREQFVFPLRPAMGWMGARRRRSSSARA